MMMSTQLAIKL